MGIRVESARPARDGATGGVSARLLGALFPSRATAFPWSFPRPARFWDFSRISRWLRARWGGAVSAISCGTSRTIRGANSAGASASFGPFSTNRTAEGSRRRTAGSRFAWTTATWTRSTWRRRSMRESRRSLWINSGDLPAVCRRFPRRARDRSQPTLQCLAGRSTKALSSLPCRHLEPPRRKAPGRSGRTISASGKVARSRASRCASPFDPPELAGAKREDRRMRPTHGRERPALRSRGTGLRARSRGVAGHQSPTVELGALCASDRRAVHRAWPREYGRTGDAPRFARRDALFGGGGRRLSRRPGAWPDGRRHYGTSQTEEPVRDREGLGLRPRGTRRRARGRRAKTERRLRRRRNRAPPGQPHLGRGRTGRSPNGENRVGRGVRPQAGGNIRNPRRHRQ